MPYEKWIADVVAATVARTCSYFDEEFGVKVTVAGEYPGEIDMLDIYGLTAIIGIGGPVSLLVAFSFEQCLIDALYERMTADVEVLPGEENEVRESVAAEIVNTIIGNCTADFQQQDRAISLTPPMVVDRVRHIHRMKDVVFIRRRMDTELGGVDISLVGPGEMFDSKLNYVK